MTTGRSGTIGVVVGDIENPFFGQAVRGISDRAGAAGFDVILANSGEDVAQGAIGHPRPSREAGRRPHRHPCPPVRHAPPAGRPALGTPPGPAGPLRSEPRRRHRGDGRPRRGRGRDPRADRGGPSADRLRLGHQFRRPDLQGTASDPPLEREGPDRGFPGGVRRGRDRGTGAIHPARRDTARSIAPDHRRPALPPPAPHRDPRVGQHRRPRGLQDAGANSACGFPTTCR